MVTWSGSPSADLTTSTTYDTVGQVLTVTVNGTLYATESYDGTTRRLIGIAYANGASLGSIDYGPTGTVDGEAWSYPAGQAPVADQVVRSQSGRVLQDTITDGTGGGATAYTSTYAYDGVGRLTEAVIPGHDLKYGFGAAGCGVATAGDDGNRTSYEDLHTSGGSTVDDTTESYCYDAADRLTGTAVSDAPAGADELLANLTQVGPGASLAYDARGALTTLGTQALSYDAAGRHIETADATGRTSRTRATRPAACTSRRRPRRAGRRRP